MRGRVAIVVVAVVATLLGSAIFASSVSTWSGYYLRTSDNHKIHYNAATGTITDLGVHVRDAHHNCIVTSDPDIRRCGTGCDHYVLSSESSWENNTTQFTYDECVNLNANNLSNVLWRADLRVYDAPVEAPYPAGTMRWVSAWAAYDYVDNGVNDRRIVDEFPKPCDTLTLANTAQLTTCGGVVDSFDRAAPPGTFNACFFVGVGIDPPGTGFPNEPGYTSAAELCYSIPGP